MHDGLILGRTLREHIGGRWAISWQVFVLNMPFNVAGVVTVMSVPPVGAQWWGWAAVAALGLAVIGLFFILGDLTWLRHRREHPVPVWSVALWGGLIGAARAAVVLGAADTLGLQETPPADVAVRVAWGALLGAVALPMGALILSCVSRFRHERERLVGERAAAERRRMQREGQVEALRAALVEGVREEVRQALDEIESRNLDVRDVSEAMRRTSHRIWSAEASGPDVPAPVSSVVRAAFGPHRIPALAIAIVWTLFAVPPLFTALGPAVAAVDLAYCFLVLWACFAVADRWARRVTHHWPLALIVMGSAAWVLVSPISYLLFDRRPLALAGPVQVVNAVWLALVVIVMTFLSGALASSEAVLRRLNEDVSDAEIATRAHEKERDRILRELAARLHGSVQSPTVAGLALLEWEGGGRRERSELIGRVGALVASLDDDVRERSLTDGITEILARWDGYLESRIHVDPAGASLDPEVRRIVEQAVEEAVVNAYRHGGARSVDIEVAAEGDAVLVRVSDDGDGVTPSPEPGLGSRFFSAVASQPWTLESLPGGGARLQVRIARSSSSDQASGWPD